MTHPIGNYMCMSPTDVLFELGINEEDMNKLFKTVNCFPFFCIDNKPVVPRASFEKWLSQLAEQRVRITLNHNPTQEANTDGTDK